MKLAIVGTRGLPNNYGGFETLAEYLAKQLSKDFDITIYCSSKDLPTRQSTFHGCKLTYVPITSHGSMGIVYDSYSLLHAVKNNDRILILGFGCGFVIPFVRKFRSKFIVNVGGLDWTRSKWSKFAQRVIRMAERLLVLNCGQLISDNVGMQLYFQQAYERASTLITYGGDQVHHVASDGPGQLQYPFIANDYAFIVVRIQPDNNIEMLLKAFQKDASMPLVIVGNWNESKYGLAIREEYSGNANLILLDAIYDQEKLDLLRSNCRVYIHGHSAGGTNPSLVEAMHLGLPIFAYASGYNEFTTHHKALYFKTAGELSKLVQNYKVIDLEGMAKKLKSIALDHYRWKNITDQYRSVFSSPTLA